MNVEMCEMCRPDTHALRYRALCSEATAQRHFRIGTKMVYTDPNPCSSEKMENGLLFSRTRGKHMGKDIGFKVGITQESQKRSEDPENEK